MTEETAEQQLRRIATTRATETAHAPEQGDPYRDQRRDPGLGTSASDPRAGRRTETDDSEGSDGDDYDDGDGDDYDESGSFLQNVWGGIKEILIIAVMALVLSFIVKTWLIQAFYIPSGSMENTLVHDDRVIVGKLTPGPFDLNRGDVQVILARDQGNWLGTIPGAQTAAPASRSSASCSSSACCPTARRPPHQRVIEMPGDHVVCCDKDGQLTINGVSITEPYQAGRHPRRRQGQLRHHRSTGQGVGDGRPPQRLERLAVPTTTARGDQ